MQRSTTINYEYAGFSPENIIQRNHLPRSTRLIRTHPQVHHFMKDYLINKTVSYKTIPVVFFKKDLLY